MIISFHVKSQFIEFGGGGGVMNYSGDLVRGFSFSTSTPAYTVFYRMNFSEIVTLKLSVILGSVMASETPIDAFASERNHSFNSSLLELAGVVEYHFLDYKSEKAPIKYSPYIFTGIGFINFSDAPNNTGKQQPVIPLGFGFKQLITKKITLGIEVGTRKTFFDYLDGISDGDQLVKDFRYGNPKDDDWYFFSGLSVSLTLFDIPCPYPYYPNSSLAFR